MPPTRLAHCRGCNARITWVTRVGDDQRLPVNVDPVSTDTDAAAGALVVVGRHGYRPADLAEVVMTSRNIALIDAHEVVRTDFPWHKVHACPPGTREAS